LDLDRDVREGVLCAVPGVEVPRRDGNAPVALRALLTGRASDRSELWTIGRGRDVLLSLRHGSCLYCLTVTRAPKSQRTARVMMPGSAVGTTIRSTVFQRGAPSA